MHKLFYFYEWRNNSSNTYQFLTFLSSDSFYALNVCAVCMQNIMFSCASACADAIQTKLRRPKMTILYSKKFTEQKFQVHKNWEIGHFSDPAVTLLLVRGSSCRHVIPHVLVKQAKSLIVAAFDRNT